MHVLTCLCCRKVRQFSSPLAPSSFLASFFYVPLPSAPPLPIIPPHLSLLNSCKTCSLHSISNPHCCLISWLYLSAHLVLCLSPGTYLLLFLNYIVICSRSAFTNVLYSSVYIVADWRVSEYHHELPYPFTLSFPRQNTCFVGKVIINNDVEKSSRIPPQFSDFEHQKKACGKYRNWMENVGWIVMAQVYQQQFFQGGGNYICWLVGMVLVTPCAQSNGRQACVVKGARGRETERQRDPSGWRGEKNGF